MPRPPLPTIGADSNGSWGTKTNTLWADAHASLDRADSRVFDVRAYPGFVGNGVNDDTAAMQACADACEVANGTYFVPAQAICRITSQLDLRYIYDVDVRGRIVVAHTTGIGVLVGASSNSTIAAKILLNEVVYGGTQSNIAIRVVGLKNGQVQINRTEYLQLYADAADTTISSIAYTQFVFGKVDKHELYGEAGISWITRNHFWGGRIATVVVTGIGYSHNDNIWHGPNLENATITFNAGNSNQFKDIRGEGTVTATFAASTNDNTGYQAWLPNATAWWSTVTVTDNGFGNDFLTTTQARATSRVLFRVDAASRTTNECSEWIMPHATARIRPGFRKLTLPTASVDYVDTGIFPIASTTPGPTVEGGMRLRRLRFQSDASIWRPKVYVYDANRVALDGTSTNYIDLTGGWTWNAGGYFSFGVNQGITPKRIVFNHPDVKFARFVLLGATTATPFAYVQVAALVESPYGDEIVDLVRRQVSRPLYKANTTVPTQSLLQSGESIGTTTGRHLVTARVDTTLSVAAAAAATTITVVSATGIATGDNIGILLDDDTTHFTSVNGAPVGSVVTLTAAMPSAAAIGKNVATNRFLHIT